MRRRLRIVVLISKTRGPSGEMVLAEQLVSALQSHPDVEWCFLFISDRYSGVPGLPYSVSLYNEIKSINPDVLITFSIWSPPISINCLHIYWHANMWRGGQDHNGTPEELATLGYDLYLTNSINTADKLLDMGFRAVYWPLFADSNLFKPVSKTQQYSCEVTYLGGNLMFKTPELVSRYIEPCAAFDLKLYGLDWEKHPTLAKFAQGALPQGDIPKLYSSAKIVLGFNAPSQRRWNMINNRVYEALSCEACFLSDFLPAMQHDFNDACVFTAGGDDTIRKVTFLLEHPKERIKHGKMGRERILESHTVQHRIEVLLKAINTIKISRQWSHRSFHYMKRKLKSQIHKQQQTGLYTPAQYVTRENKDSSKNAPIICLKHHFLRDNIADLILRNRWLVDNFIVIDITEPMGTPVSKVMWKYLPVTGALAIIWGMSKYGAAVFVEYSKEKNLPFIFIERSPLLVNGRKSFYFDPYGTTDHGLLCRDEFLTWLEKQSLNPRQEKELADLRESYQGRSSGVDDQATQFETREEILSKLKLSSNAKILFVPLQVDNDITIVDKQSSPFINNMMQFVSLIVNNADSLPNEYRIIIKEHPANIRYGEELKHNLSHPRISFIRDEINANALTQQCDAICSVNSGVGMEGLVFHKPLIACGNSFYSKKKLNWDVRTEEELREAFRNLDSYKVDKERIDKFIHYFVFEYSYDLTQQTDCMKLIERFEKICNREISTEAAFFPGS